MDGHYFQFPLCALSFGRNMNERLNCIIDLGCVETGLKQWEKFTPNQRIARRSFYPSPHLCTCRIDLSKDEELQGVAGCEYLNIVCNDVKGMLANYARLRRFIEEFERRHGTDARVRSFMAKDYEI
jgi:hypothetical protein